MPYYRFERYTHEAITSKLPVARPEIFTRRYLIRYGTCVLMPNVFITHNELLSDTMQVC